MDKHLFELPSPELVATTPCIDHGQKCKRGRVRLNGVVVPVYRAVFCNKHDIDISEIKHFQVLHACSNVRCIEPSHLFLYPASMANPFEFKKEARELSLERKKAQPSKYLYLDYLHYPDKEYVN